MTIRKKRILIVEDHAALAQNLSDFFPQESYSLDFAFNGLAALHLLSSNTYDVIILDIMLPGINGFEICKRLRNDLLCYTPVIMMTAKDQLVDKEEGFDLGADDYLIKPFNLRELQLRVDAIFRRSNLGKTTRLKAGPISFDPGTLTIHEDTGKSLEISGVSAKVFEALIRSYPNFISYDELNNQIWGDRELDLHILRTHVYTLRKQLYENFERLLIKTLHGRGYRLTPPKEIQE